MYFKNISLDELVNSIVNRCDFAIHEDKQGKKEAGMIPSSHSYTGYIDPNGNVVLPVASINSLDWCRKYSKKEIRERLKAIAQGKDIPQY